MEQITPLQSNCLSVIGELDNPRKSAINHALLEQYDFHGNSGSVQFALLTLIERGLIEREQQVIEQQQQGASADSYSLTERGKELLR